MNATQKSITFANLEKQGVFFQMLSQVKTDNVKIQKETPLKQGVNLIPTSQQGLFGIVKGGFSN